MTIMERLTALDHLRALVDEVGSEPIRDNRALRMGAWIRARNYLEALEDEERLKRYFDDIVDRDLQTRPITDPGALPLGCAGTIYDHARERISEYHLDSESLALGDRHLLVQEVKRLRREMAIRGRGPGHESHRESHDTAQQSGTESPDVG